MKKTEVYNKGIRENDVMYGNRVLFRDTVFSVSIKIEERTGVVKLMGIGLNGGMSIMFSERIDGNLLGIGIPLYPEVCVRVLWEDKRLSRGRNKVYCNLVESLLEGKILESGEYKYLPGTGGKLAIVRINNDWYKWYKREEEKERQRKQDINNRNYLKNKL